MRLTGAGETFLGYARTLLATVEQAQAALQLPQQISGRLRIALADSVCSTFLPDLLQRYHAQFPQVELVLCTATDDGMLQMLTTNQVDLAYTLDHPLLQPTLVRAVHDTVKAADPTLRFGISPQVNPDNDDNQPVSYTHLTLPTN